MAEINDSTKKTTKSLMGGLLSLLPGSNRDSETLGKNSSDSEILGGIYKLMVQKEAFNKLEYERRKNYLDEEEIERNKRHNEIIKALSIRRKPAPKKIKAKERVSMPQMPGIPGRSPTPSRAPTPAPAPSPARPSAPAPAAPVPAPARPSAPAPSQTPARQAEPVKPDAAEIARQQAAERARRAASERTRKDAEDKARKEAQERAAREAQERATREAAEAAKIEGQRRAAREAQERAAREAQERTAREARRESDREARRSAEGAAREREAARRVETPPAPSTTPAGRPDVRTGRGTNRSETPSVQPAPRPPATAQRQPSQAAPPATATPAPPVSIPPSAVAVGTGALVGTSALLNAIKGAEGGGNYDIAFGDVKMRDGTLQNRLKNPQTKEFLNLKTPEQWSEETLGEKKKLTEMKLSEVLQFQKYRSRAWPSSGAAGSYGFMPSTLFGQDFFTKASGGVVRTLGLSMDTIFNKETQDKLAVPLLEDNLTYLRNNGVPTTPGWAYASWYVGRAGATAIWKAIQKGDGDKRVGEILNDAKIKWGPNVNPELGAEKFNGGMKNTGSNFPVLLQGRLVQKGGLHMTPLENTRPSGNPLNESSTTNRDLRSQSNPGDQRQQTINNINVASPAAAQQRNRSVVDDSSAYARKSKQ